MKKALSILLSLLLILSTGSTAFAAVPASELPAESSQSPNMDEKLAEVTSAVKNTLGIGDHYTKFYGELNDKGIRQVWILNWSSDDESLNVQADASGKILSFNRNKNEYSYRYSYDFAPKFPTVSREQAKGAAEAFLKKVLLKNETVDLDVDANILSPTEVDRYYFNAMLKVNGLETPISISMSISTEDMGINHFNRSDAYSEYIGTFPSATPVTTKEKAAELLASQVKMKLQYMLESDSKDNPKAVLRYLPVYTGTFVVDAKTGKLINTDAMYRDMLEGGATGMNTSAADMATQEEKALTAVEREGISKLEGVLTKEQLDAKARAISELGILSDFTLNNVSYSLNQETNEVTAYLSYSLRMNPEGEKAGAGATSSEKQAVMATAGYVSFIYKTVTLNAKTGAFQSINTSYPYREEYSEIKRDRAALQKKAEGFLTKYFNEPFSKTALYENAETVTPYRSYDYNYYTPSESFLFSQIENDVFFPINRLDISINAETGTIDNFYMNWIDGVTFESTDDIITNSKASALYAAAYDTKLSYVSVPVAIDPSRPDHVRYAEFGYSYVYEFILGYSQYSDKYISEVNAKTGEVISYDLYQQTKPVAYDDISGHYAEAKINKLAQYGVAFPGKSFQPKKQLTQLDMLLLLLSADGLRYDHTDLTEDEINNVYSNAYYRNILTKADRNPKKLMTRSDVIRTILSMSGYGKTANLKGIYKVSFKDAASIREADYGYVAIAQGLGIINGDNTGNVKPYDAITRVEAALMLYNFMSRK